VSGLKIPFGIHKPSGKLVDASWVPSGLACQCTCHECGGRLEAVHSKLGFRVDYFRHHTSNGCTGGLESLFHKAAKQILRESTVLRLSCMDDFVYTQCDIETPRHGKRPDAYIANESGGLIVEVLFTHAIEDSTLDIYLQNGERVLEIDISSEKKSIFNYERLKQLILSDAPRFVYEEEVVVQSSQNNDWGFGWLLVAFFVFLGLLAWAVRRRRR
jgi:hypothetical protein